MEQLLQHLELPILLRQKFEPRLKTARKKFKQELQKKLFSQLNEVEEDFISRPVFFNKSSVDLSPTEMNRRCATV